MSSRKIVSNSKFFEEVRSILTQARQKAYAAINIAMVDAYWEIGCRTVEEEQRGKGCAYYVAFLINQLSKQLTAEFGKGLQLPILEILGSFILSSPNFKNATRRVVMRCMQ